LYKKRGVQKQLIVLNFCVTIAIILIEYFEVSNFKVKMGILQGHWQLSAILPFFIITFLIFAYRGIRKDEKLLDSSDRLR
jgi:F0F1-type ATP synthase assembly protein I